MKRRTLLLQLDDASAESVNLEATSASSWLARIGKESDRRDLSLSLLRGGERPIVLIGGRVVSLWVHSTSAESRVHHGGAWHSVRAATTTPRTSAARRDDGTGKISAPMPGRIVQVQVREGEDVASGAPLLVIEAMKMQNALFAPRAGRVKRILVEEGQTIERGVALLELELTSDAAP